MNWIDIASIVFVCVTMNHLGLVKAVEEKVGYNLMILNCVKCSTFWFTLIYTTTLSHQFIAPLAISFLASYIALWLELLEGYIDTLYNNLYDKIYNTTADAPASDPE